MHDDPRNREQSDELRAALADDPGASGSEVWEPYDDEYLEAEAEEAFSRGDELPSSGLLSFYDRLRERIVDYVDRKGGRLGEQTAKVLLLIPDIFVLLVRLILDKETPAASRALIGGALAYFLLPLDLLPEALVGVGGYVDDLVLATVILAQSFGGEIEPLARRHWSGDEELRVVIRDVSSVARSLLGESLYERLRALLARRGVELDEEADRPAGEEAPPPGEDFEPVGV